MKKLNVYPLLENHKHLKGIDKLLDESVFRTAQLGECGEILWPQIIESKDASIWDYDISPEYFYFNGELVSAS